MPRIVPSEADYRAVPDAVDLPANGVPLCSGPLGARVDDDLPGMLARPGQRVHVLLLRNGTRDADTVPCSFQKAERPGVGTDMVALIAAILAEHRHPRAAGRADWSNPFRPDCGQDIPDDIGKPGQHGYPGIGQMKRLEELRGMMTALDHPLAAGAA